MKKARELFASSRALRAGLVMNILTATLTLAAFAPVEPGAGVRPLAWASAVFALAFVSLALGIGLANVDVSRGGSRAAAWGFACCLVPFPLAMLLFKLFVEAKGLRVLP